MSFLVEDGGEKDRSIHWMSWEKLSRSKSRGGMGFRNIRDFNVAMVGRQGWRLLIKPDSLVARVYKARNYPQSSFLNASIGETRVISGKVSLKPKKL